MWPNNTRSAESADLHRDGAEHRLWSEGRMPDKVTFGSWLREEMDRRSWTPGSFRQRMEIKEGGLVVFPPPSEATVSRWLADKMRPHPASLTRILDILGMDGDARATARQLADVDCSEVSS